MVTLFDAAILMIFFLWAHRLIHSCYHTPNPASVSPAPPKTSAWYQTLPWRYALRFFRLLIPLVIFFGCYLLIRLHQGTIREQQFQEKGRSTLYDTNHNTEAGSDTKEGNSINNFIDIIAPNKVNTKFTDVAGMLETKEEVEDVIHFLRSPEQFTRLGAKAPKGVLMYGPPGTGKTLLARAIAGEAGVTFIAVSGAQFEEEYVGVGAGRVRQLFQLARNHAPCIMFIDEIDAVAFKRNSGKNAPWLAQTVNQLLTEMDGLDELKNAGIVVVAATNRLEALDQAILRPGRFDRQLRLELPTLLERKAILRVHLKKIKHHNKLDVDQLAKLSMGFSGAELANLVNEAAISATKKHKPNVEQSDFDYARDRLLLGSRRSAVQLSDKEKRITAYHEAGHALVAISLDGHDPVTKITIAPRGKALGYTAFQPQTEKHAYSRRYLENTIAVTLGGRIAESLIFGEDEITTGAENDFKHATELTHNMVTRWGFSKRLSVLNDPEMRLVNKSIIEKEMQQILEHNYKIAKTILQNNLPKLHKIAAALLEHETLEAEDVKKLLAGMPSVNHPSAKSS
jgi:cell division protease FtsH